MNSFEQILPNKSISIELGQIDLQYPHCVDSTYGNQGAISVCRVFSQIVLKIVGYLDHLGDWEFQVKYDLFAIFVTET